MKDEDKRGELSGEEIVKSLKLIADLFQDPIAQTDITGIFQNVNPSFQPVLGYSREELVGKSAFDLIHPDDVAKVLEAFKKSMESKIANRIEYRYRHAGGHYIWLETNIQALLDNKGDFLATVFSGRDITVYKRVEEERNRIFELSLDMLCVASLDGYFVELNPAWEKTLGWSPEELKAKPYLEFVHPEDRESTLNSAKTNLESTPAINFTNRFQCKGGTYRWLSWSTSPHSEQELFYCVVRDVTEQKETAEALQEAHDKLEIKVKERTAELSRANEELQAEISERISKEKALQQSEEKYRYLAENLKDVIWTADLEGNLTYISPAIEELIGFTPEEVMAMPISDYVVQEDYVAMLALLAEELAKSPAERKRSASIQARYRTRDNRLVYIEQSTSWILDEQGNTVGLQGTTRDITARKQLEDQIIESRRMYRSVVDTQQEMVARCLPDTTLTFVNDAYCRTFGKSRQELLGQKFLDFTPPELHDETIELIRSLTPDNPSVMHEHFVLAGDGSIRWQEWSEQAFFTETGEIKELQGVGRDITERVQAEKNMLQAYDATIEGWAYALDLKDVDTEDHSKRVTDTTLSIARIMNIKDEDLAHVRRGALLHDIGKMGIPDSILLKPGKLDDDEWTIMKKHPVYAYEMLVSIDYLKPALDIPYCHHEKWDGTGYPRGLKGKAIPLAARIFAVADVYDALTSDRPYRKAWSKENTLSHIREESGKHFDPEVVKVFLKVIG
jgi:PAS domain S-box-containing protein/putative nucleotidyltransferase with HDIG domain